MQICKELIHLCCSLNRVRAYVESETLHSSSKIFDNVFLVLSGIKKINKYILF